MSKASIHRRLRELEAVTAWARTIDYPPLTHAEIIGIEQRMRAGGMLTRPEMDRLEQYSPIVDGELLMGCWKGRFTMKRYLGVDLSEWAR
jgi:hypothetical protein